MIVSSSGEKPVSVGSSVGDNTPPLAWNLIKSAPARRRRRTALRTSSGPSTRVSGHSAPAPLVDRRRTPDGIVSSPCPPGWGGGPTEIFMPRAGVDPLVDARLHPRGRPPRFAPRCKARMESRERVLRGVEKLQLTG